MPKIDWKKVLGVMAGGVLLLHLHVAGGLVLLGSLSSAALLRRWRQSETAAQQHFDFGWGAGWMNGLAIAALIFLIAAVALQIAHPALWPLAGTLLVWVPIFGMGNGIMRSFRRRDFAVLPMVNLLQSDHDSVLDAGCGAGRTIIALAPMLKNGTITGVDRFDAPYIHLGGRALLDKNLALASITDRIRIETADLTRLPFPDATFDSAISTNVFDHLGQHKQKALQEVFRVLRPGGRFLLALWVPDWTAFVVANVFSLFLTSKMRWRELLADVGFLIIEEGKFNYAWYVLLEKPSSENPL